MEKILKEYGLVIIGNIILAIGVGCIIIPGNILTGGLSGIAIALAPAIHIQPDIIIYTLELVFFVLGYFILGKQFALKTLLSSVTYPLFLFIILSFKIVIPISNPIVGSIYGGMIIGIGVGLVFRMGASTGGMDIPALIVAKYTGIYVAVCVATIDILTVLLGIATHGMENALIGIFSTIACAYAINKVLVFGTHASFSILIISDEYLKIKQEIKTTLNRGCTILNGVGGYTDQEKSVILVVVNQKEYPKLQQIAMSIDPNSFIIVNDAKEVHGQGFLQQHIEKDI